MNSQYEEVLEALQDIVFDSTLTDYEKRSNLHSLQDEIEDMIANLS